MSNIKSKICPACKIVIRGGNEQVVNHMMKSFFCKKRIMYCIGCNKPCADATHLSNHQKQQIQTKGNTFCIQGIQKLEKVQTLSANNPLYKTQPSSDKKRKIFSIEQPVSMLPTGKTTKKSRTSNHLYITKDNTKPLFENDIMKSSLLENYSISTMDNLSKDNVLGVTTNRKFYSNRNDFIKTNYSHTYQLNNEVESFIMDVDNSSNIESDSSISTSSNLHSTFNEALESIVHNFDQTHLHTSKNTSSIISINNRDINTKYIETSASKHSSLSQINLNNSNPNTYDQQSQISSSNYINKKIQSITTHREQTLFSYTDKAMIDLYLMHRKCNAPTYMFDETFKWLEKHIQTLVSQFNPTISTKITFNSKLLPSRNTFVQQMYNKLYSKKMYHESIPKEIHVKIDVSNYIKMTIVDFKEVIVDMLANQDIMNSSNLLFYNYNDPTKVHPRDSDVGEIITSDVFLNTHQRLCKKPNDVLFPLIFYNDEINIDNYSKLSLDPFSVTFGRLKLDVRNQPNAWRYFGFINKMKQHDTDTNLNGEMKMKFYHKCLKELLTYLKSIQNDMGIPFAMKLRNGSIVNVNLIIYVQFIIGDTKGHDILCGRMGSHHLSMNQLVRDCCVTPNNSDNINHICKYRKLTEVKTYSTSQQFKDISFYKVDNPFYEIDMGDNIHGIFGATLAEPLHVFQMQLLELESEEFSNLLSTKSLKCIQYTIIDIVALVERQSCKSDFLPVNAFREGLTKVKRLTGSERHAKLFVIYLALLSSQCIQNISTYPAKHEYNSKTQLGTFKLQQWLALIEDSLILMSWLGKKSHQRKEIYSRKWFKKWVIGNDSNQIPTDNDDKMCSSSPAQNSIKKFMKNYKEVVDRDIGNGLKIPKFHFLLHFVRNIARHGSVRNYDGSRPEAIAKYIAKSPGKRTQKHHKSLSIQTATRYHEDITILEAERLYHRNESMKRKRNKKKNSPNDSYSYFNKDLKNTIDDSKYIFKGSKFDLCVDVYQDDNETSKLKIIGKVCNVSKGINARIDDQLLCCLTNWLWIDGVGGRLKLDNTVKCFTEMKLKGENYKCHPSYRSECSWNDWIYVDWGQGYPKPLPAILYMLIDISGCDIESEDSQFNQKREGRISNYRMISKSMRQTHDTASKYLESNKKFAIIQSCNDDGFIDKSNYPSNFTLFSKIANRVVMENDKYRIIPIEQICGRALGFFDHLPSINISQNPTKNVAVIVDHPDTWSEKFIDSRKC